MCKKQKEKKNALSNSKMPMSLLIVIALSCFWSRVTKHLKQLLKNFIDFRL